MNNDLNQIARDYVLYKHLNPFNTLLDFSNKWDLVSLNLHRNREFKKLVAAYENSDSFKVLKSEYNTAGTNLAQIKHVPWLAGSVTNPCQHRTTRYEPSDLRIGRNWDKRRNPLFETAETRGGRVNTSVVKSSYRPPRPAK